MAVSYTHLDVYKRQGQLPAGAARGRRAARLERRGQAGPDLTPEMCIRDRPYVPVPKDLTRVKTKFLFNLTPRQLVCLGGGALVGIPLFFQMCIRDSTSPAQNPLCRERKYSL